MKIKKVALIFLVIMLSFTLTACDNWQDGIDEVQDTKGPSWDVDLKIPLLPETEIKLGSLLAEFLDIDEDEFDEDLTFTAENTLNEDQLTENGRIELMEEEINFGDQIDLSDVNYNIEEGINFNEVTADGSFKVSDIENTLTDLSNDFDFSDTIPMPDTKEYNVDLETVDQELDFGENDFALNYNETINVEVPKINTDQVFANLEKTMTEEITSLPAFDRSVFESETTVKIPDISGLSYPVDLNKVYEDSGETLDVNLDSLFEFNVDKAEEIDFKAGSELIIKIENTSTVPVTIDIDLNNQTNNENVVGNSVELTGNSSGEIRLDLSTQPIPASSVVSAAIQIDGDGSAGDIIFSSETSANFEVEEITLADPVEITDTDTFSIEQLPAEVKSAIIEEGELSFAIDAGVLDNDINIDILKVTLAGEDLNSTSNDALQRVFSFADQEITGGEDIVVDYQITIDTITETKNLPEQVVIDFTKTKDFKVGKVNIKDGADIINPVTTSIDLDFGENSEFVKQLIFNDGEIRINVDDKTLDLDYQLTVSLDGENLEDKLTGDSFDLKENSSARTIDLVNKEQIEIEVDVSINSFKYPENDENVNIDVEVLTENLDWNIDIEDYQVQEIDLFAADMDLENIEEIVFSENSKISFAVTEFEAEDYTIEVELIDKNDNSLYSEDVKLTSANRTAEIDLSSSDIGKNINKNPKAKVTFTGSINQSTDRVKLDITPDVEIDLVKFDQNNPETYEEVININVEDLPEEAKSIEFTEGKIEVEIGYNNLEHIDFKTLELKLSENETAEFKFDENNDVYYLDLSGEIFEKQDGEWKDMEVIVNAAITEIDPGQGDVSVDVSLVEDLDIGKITFEENAISERREFDLLDGDEFDGFDDLEEYLDDINYLVFDKADLELEIIDAGWEIDFDIALSVNEDEVDYIKDNNKYIFDLSDTEIELVDNNVGEKELKLNIDFDVNSLVYDSELATNNNDNDITINGSLPELSWQEVNLNPNNLIKEYNIIDDIDSFEIGLGEYKDLLDKIELERDGVNLFIYMDNNSNLDLDLQELDIIAIDENGNETRRETVSLDIPANIEDKDVFTDELRDTFFDIVEEYPEKIKLEGGTLSSNKDVSIYKDDSLYADADYKINLNFKLKADSDEDTGDFIYRLDPIEIEIEDDMKDNIQNNLKEVKFVEELVYELPAKGTVKLYIGEFDPDNQVKKEFYEQAEFSTDLIELPDKSSELHRYETNPEDSKEMIELITSADKDYYVGFKVIIPTTDEEISFNKNQKLTLKMWSNVVVKVNSQD